jgi:hypothetical protein
MHCGPTCCRHVSLWRWPPALAGVWSGRELILGRAPGAKGAAIVAAVPGVFGVLLDVVRLNVLRASGPSRLTVLASFGIRHTLSLVIALWALNGIPMAAVRVASSGCRAAGAARARIGLRVRT